MPATHAAEALKLHPANPHYFQWRGKPTVLITSGEHYGAVLNADFNYARYLDALAQDKLNLTRTFTGGTYVEPAQAFNIAHNTLAPLAGEFLSPFARSSQPGYRGGGNKFDLERWDAAYFARFRDFVRQAAKRGVVVEVNLFCPFYEDSMWRLSPLHPENNVNGVGAGLARTNMYTLDKHGGTLAIQEKLVRKFVEELRDADNVYYEICNEPYFGGVTMDWQKHIARVITEAQRGHRAKKLISQNVANDKALVTDPPSEVSIFNFHYATPPDTVAMNWHLNRVIGDNETGFKGTNDAPYRMEGWEFILAGGGLFNHLDYSFVAGHEGGDFAYPANQPGGGNATLRRQLRALQDFISRFNFVKMQPDQSIIRDGAPEGWRARALVEPNRACALYLRPVDANKPRRLENAPLRLNLPAGTWQMEWISPLTGEPLVRSTVKHEGTVLQLTVPGVATDVALALQRR